MQTTLKVLTCIILLYTCGVACSEEGKRHSNVDSEISQPLNPNGDSELALLMRAMYDEADQIKQQIANGDSIVLSLDHEQILTAHATEPDKVASVEYKAFARTYIQAMKSLRDASSADRLKVYNNMVANCMTCHKALCPGPMVKIKKLM